MTGKFLIIEIIAIPVVALILLYLFSISGAAEWCNTRGLDSFAGLIIAFLSIVIGMGIADKLD